MPKLSLFDGDPSTRQFNHGLHRLFHLEVAHRIIETDVFDHFSDKLYIIGVETTFDLIAQIITKNPTEVFMAWIR